MAQMKWFVGVDWGSRTHQACILDGAGVVRGEQAFKHGGAGLAAMAAWIADAADATGSKTARTTACGWPHEKVGVHSPNICRTPSRRRCATR